MIVTIRSECDKGCLKCSPEDICLFCNLLNFYYLQNGVCIEQKPEFCYLIDQVGVCTVCQEGYYLDIQKNCIKVTTEQQIIGCILYDSQSTCLKCKPGQIIIDTECKDVPTLIDNCEDYSSDGLVCLDCFKEFFQETSTKCTAIETQPHCLGVNRYNCL